VGKRDWWVELRSKEPPFTWQEKLLLGLLLAESALIALWTMGAFQPR
jgi:hypothetical protein